MDILGLLDWADRSEKVQELAPPTGTILGLAPIAAKVQSTFHLTCLTFFVTQIYSNTQEICGKPLSVVSGASMPLSE